MEAQWMDARKTIDHWGQGGEHFPSKVPPFLPKSAE
jgi:hypothetical protein